MIAMQVAQHHAVDDVGADAVMLERHHRGGAEVEC